MFMCVYLLLLVHVITTTTIMISVLLLLLPYVGGAWKRSCVGVYYY